MDSAGITEWRLLLPFGGKRPERAHGDFQGAEENDNFETLKYLLNKFPKYNIYTKDVSGNTIFHIIATFNKSLEILKYLIENFSFDIYTKNNNGDTIFHSACLSENPKEIFELLFKKFPDFNIYTENNDGKTILDTLIKMIY